MDITKITGIVDEISNYIVQKLEMPMELAKMIVMKKMWFNFSWNCIGLIIGILLIVGGIVYFKKYKKFLKTLNEGSRKYDEYKDAEYLGIIPWIIGAGVAFINLYNILYILISPEWYVFERIIKPMLR